MALVTVKKKFQVVIPRKLREEIGVDVGDILEAKVERGKITFAPKTVIDRSIAEGLKDFREGRSYGPFNSPDELLASLRAQTKKLTAARASKQR